MAVKEQRAHHQYGVIPQRASLSPGRIPATNKPVSDDLEEDESYYPIRPSSSAIRYTTTQDQQVIQQGNKRIILHHEPPPGNHQQPPPAPVRVHWLTVVGIFMLTMLVGWVVLTLFSGWIQQQRNDLLYENPRIFQLDANVGHYGRVSHFVALNLHGYLEIIETQERHPEAAKIYTPTALLINPTDPVILSFQDVNGDGKPDMIITAPSFQEVMFNTGTSFQSQPPEPSH